MEPVSEEFKAVLPFLVPVFLLEVGLMVFALVDLVRRKRVRGDNKVLWAILIVLVQIMGPILYLVLGRKEEAVDSDKD
jgi:hypothetical protein